MAYAWEQSSDVHMQTKGSAEAKPEPAQGLTDQPSVSSSTVASHTWDAALDLFFKQHDTDQKVDWRRKVSFAGVKMRRLLKPHVGAEISLYCDDLHISTKRTDLKPRK